MENQCRTRFAFLNSSTNLEFHLELNGADEMYNRSMAMSLVVLFIFVISVPAAAHGPALAVSSSQSMYLSSAAEKQDDEQGKTQDDEKRRGSYTVTASHSCVCNGPHANPPGINAPLAAIATVTDDDYFDAVDQAIQDATASAHAGHVLEHHTFDQFPAMNMVLLVIPGNYDGVEPIERVWRGKEQETSLVRVYLKVVAPSADAAELPFLKLKEKFPYEWKDR